MLLVAEKGREADVQKVFEKWDLPCSVIGEVTDNGLLDFYMNGELEASIPAHELVLGGGAPQYDREFKEPLYLAKINQFDPASVEVPDDLRKVAETLVKLPSIASKRWIYNQYDSMVGTNNTSTNAPTDAAVVLVKGTTKGIAVTTDCNSRYVYADPYKGAMIAVSEAARNIVCSGGLPLGVTNCLNFGNPYDPEVYYQFVQAIKGMGDACRKFETPVTGGNVSFYNQNPDGPVFPTPTIGMVGLLEDVSKKMTLHFKSQGDLILLIGSSNDDINSSQYLAKIAGVHDSPAPYFDIDEEYALQQTVATLINNGLVESAHDVSDGGLFICLLEAGFTNGLGFDVVASDADIRKDGYWFGEKQSRVVVTVKREKLEAIKKALGNHPYEELGLVTDGSVEVDGMEWGMISDWKESYDTAIENYLSKEEAGAALSSI